MKIFVKLPQEASGKTIPVEVDASDTLETVQQIVQDKEGIPYTNQSLFFNGRRLDEVERPLSAYNIQNESTLELTCM